MSTVIRTELDDTQVAAGFKRMQAGAASTSTAFAKWSNQTAGAAKVSAEGLGFVSQALGRISPQLALLGEQSTKQLPTIMALGQSMSKYVFAGGALAAIGASAGKIAFEMAKVRHETIDANSALGQFIETSNTIKPNTFLGRLMNGTVNGALRLLGTSTAEIEEQQRDIARGGSWRDKGDEARNRSEGIAYNLRAGQSQRAKIKDYTSGVEGIDSVDKINQFIEAEKKRIAGLVQLGKLTDEEAQASDAYTQALEQQYDVVIGRINDLRDVETQLATEEKQRWIEDIKTKQEAKKALDDMIGEYHQLYNTNQLTAKRQKELLAGIANAQAKYNEKLNEERQFIKDNIALIKEQTQARIEQRAEMEKQRQGEVKGWAQQLRDAAKGGGAGHVGDGGLAQQGGGPNGWRAWGGAAAMGINPFGPGMGNATGGDVQAGGDDGGMPVVGLQANGPIARRAAGIARRELKAQIQQIRKAFDDEMAAADKLEKQGIDVKDQRKEIARRRNQKLAEARGDRDDNEREAMLQLQRDARDKQVEAAAKRRDMGREQIELLKKVVELQDIEIADQNALQKDLDAIRAVLGRAANNQRANAR